MSRRKTTLNVPAAYRRHLERNRTGRETLSAAVERVIREMKTPLLRDAEKKTQLCVRLPEQAGRFLSWISKQFTLSESAVLREAIRQEIERKRKENDE